MLDLSFQFAQDVAKKAQAAAAAKLRKLAGVHAVQPLDPESDDPVISRMWFVQVVDQQNLDDAKNLLARLPGIESVEEPPRRELVW